MPYLIQDLIEGRAKPVTVKLGASLQQALALMIEFDFSQLPVVDEEERPVGLITSDSILRALKNFEETISKLRVSDAALSRVISFGEEDKVVDILDEVLRQTAVLIVDGSGKLRGIVTSYDTTEFFRRRAEDMMFVEDIEGLLKEFILAAFRTSYGEIDDEQLAAAIQQITPSNSEIRGDFGKALKHYLEHSSGGGGTKFHNGHAQAAFDAHILKTSDPKPFERLSMDEYIQLFLHDTRWKMYEPIFGVGQASIRKLLWRVRDSRNTLAHFRDELTSEQRHELRFCLNWLEQYEAPVSEAFSAPLEPQVAQSSGSLGHEPHEGGEEEIFPVEEEADLSSRYAPLARYLQRQPFGKSLELSFSDVESIIEGKLPDTARRHRAWWANDSVSHVQSREWLDVDWRVARVSMSEERVSFVRIKERERAYIEFYNRMLQLLPENGTIAWRHFSPGGYNWHNLLHLPEGAARYGTLALAFAHQRRFRIELYIEAPSSYDDRQDVNKRLFDEIESHREAIEAQLGAALVWERLSDRRASRIAWYEDDIAITDSEEALEELRQKTAERLPRFYEALASHFAEAVRKLLEEGPTP